MSEGFVSTWEDEGYRVTLATSETRLSVVLTNAEAKRLAEDILKGFK